MNSIDMFQMYSLSNMFRQFQIFFNFQLSLLSLICWFFFQPHSGICVNHDSITSHGCYCNTADCVQNTGKFVFFFTFSSEHVNIEITCHLLKFSIYFKLLLPCLTTIFVFAGICLMYEENKLISYVSIVLDCFLDCNDRNKMYIPRSQFQFETRGSGSIKV